MKGSQPISRCQLLKSSVFKRTIKFAVMTVEKVENPMKCFCFPVKKDDSIVYASLFQDTFICCSHWE